MGGGEQRLAVSVTAPSGGMASGSSAANASASLLKSQKWIAFTVLKFVKWPIAVLFILISPAVAQSCWNLVSSEVTNNSGLFWGVGQFQRSLDGLHAPDFVSLGF